MSGHWNLRKVQLPLRQVTHTYLHPHSVGFMMDGLQLLLYMVWHGTILTYYYVYILSNKDFMYKQTFTHSCAY